MIISKALPEEYNSVRLFYYSLIDAMDGSPYHPMWQKDIYPSQEELKSAVEAGELFIGRCADRIAAAMVLNQKCNSGYDHVKWPTSLRSSEYMVIHMLGVHNDFARQGLAKEMVRSAIVTAKNAGMKAIRLDVLKGNVPAERLYPSLGFEYVDTIKLYYADTGCVDFELYEYNLSDIRSH